MSGSGPGGGTEVCEVIVTGPDQAWLAGFARRLVQDRLAACGHLTPEMRAVFRWEEALHDEPEARLALHTRASLVAVIVERATREHPDDVPCVLALPVTDGHPGYLRWVVDETVPRADRPVSPPAAGPG